MCSKNRGHRYVWDISKGDGRSRGTLLPVVLDDFIPIDYACRVIDAFVDGLSMSELGFERADSRGDRKTRL
jgi:hypothetical protein